MGRSLDQHIDNEELNALVPWYSKTGQVAHGLSAESVRDAKRHLKSCLDCSSKVAKYSHIVDRFSTEVFSSAALPGVECPEGDGVDWHEVAVGLWPKLKATQLIRHAATCDHCGPLLRVATSMSDSHAPEERLLEPMETHRAGWSGSRYWQFTSWLVPALALLLIVGVVRTLSSSSSASLFGPKFAELAVNIHRQYAAGHLPLEVRADSEQALNEWLKKNGQRSLALPAPPAVPGEERPYHLQGARLMQVAGKTVAFVAYQMQSGAVSLIVAPDSVAVASGGVAANFRKVSFHYAMVDGYKVVTWSQHGLTYALSSQEGNSTQQSCMVCHSAMRDRDLSKTPTPLYARERAPRTLWQ